MQSVLKSALRYLGIGRSFRWLRNVFYLFLDFTGEAVFFLLRLLCMLPKEGMLEEDKVKKILLIRIDRVGDLIVSSPAMRAVRERFSLAQIHLLVAHYTKDLAVNNPNINKIVIYNKDTLDNDYDLAIALHPGLIQNYLAFASGARWRIGYTGMGGSFFLTHKLKDDRQRRIRHEVESALEVVGIAGCTTENKSLEVSVTEEGERIAESFLMKNGLSPSDFLVVIHPGARQEYIRWKKEGYAKAADTLIKEEKAKVILIADTKEKQLIEDVVSLMAQRPVVAIGIKLTGLVSLIKKCRLFIGNSSGPMHIAAALGVPVVAIFGNIHPLDSYQEWGPWGEDNVVVHKDLACPRCHPSDCRDFTCMESITAEEVIEAVRRKISDIRMGKNRRYYA